MDFNDLYQSSRKRRLSTSKKLRFCCIFLVVAALTGVILWKLVPRSAKSPETRIQEPGSNSPETAVSEKATPPPAAEEKKRDSAELQPKKKSEQKSPARKSSVKTRKPVSDVQGQGREPAKGIPATADLPAQLDRPVIPQEPSLNTDHSKRIAELEQLYKERKFAEVTEKSEILLAALTVGSKPYRQTLKYLTEANWQRFLNRDTSNGFAVRYTVVSGDQLGIIARKKQTTVAAVVKANKLKRAGLIRIGQKLTLLSGKWQIRVSKSKRLLFLMRNDKIFAGFDIGIGRFGKTPTADFVIAERLKHPVYRTADGRIFKYGERGNQLGDYFLKLASVGTPRRPLLGYGIHGTPDETTVSRSLSNGCIRMRNADVEKLYYLVPAGIPVGIRD